MLAIKTILHPTDFSERSDLAFRLACSLARDHGARLIILHVAEPPVPPTPSGIPIVPAVLDLDSQREQLQRLRPADPKVPVEHRLIVGAAAAEILDVAEASKCDLIVMGTHGRTGLGRLLMGSVAEQVVRKAPCPVLTVKTPPHTAQSSQEPVAVAAGKGAEAMQ
jgi:nucleotide-binding universal stress UspA family protein